MLELYLGILILCGHLKGLQENIDYRMASRNILSVEFEVFGQVQGVFFRKYTQQQADKLGIRGWCRNTKSGTVEGTLEGYQDKINEMKHWLQTIGSPQSSIDKAEFQKEKEISEFTLSKFEIRK